MLAVLSALCAAAALAPLPGHAPRAMASRGHSARAKTSGVHVRATRTALRSSTNPVPPEDKENRPPAIDPHRGPRGTWEARRGGAAADVDRECVRTRDGSTRCARTRIAASTRREGVLTRDRRIDAVARAFGDASSQVPAPRRHHRGRRGDDPRGDVRAGVHAALDGLRRHAQILHRRGDERARDPSGDVARRRRPRTKTLKRRVAETPRGASRRRPRTKTLKRRVAGRRGGGLERRP